MSFDDSKGSVMLEFRAAAEKKPTVEDVKQQFNLADEEIDNRFGVLPMGRPQERTFVAVVSAEAIARIEKQKLPGFVQRWSNGPIEI